MVEQKNGTWKLGRCTAGAELNLVPVEQNS
eukprot:SAG31_NODE_15007_length_776_cov_0.911374_1_plen_29_part_10